MLLVFLWIEPGAFAAEFHFNSRTFSKWQVKNYEQRLKFEVKKDPESGKEYLKITSTDFSDVVGKGKKEDSAFSLISRLLRVMPKKCYSLRINKRSSFDMPDSKGNRGWNHIVWYNMIRGTPLNFLVSFRWSTDKGMSDLMEFICSVLVQCQGLGLLTS